MAESVPPGPGNRGHPPKGDDMRNHVRHSRSERSLRAFEEGHERESALAAPAGFDDGDDGFEEDAGHYAARRAAAEDSTEDETDDTDEAVRLLCPDCGRPIAVLLDALNLPQHAVCATPWNPFGLTVCAGSGRPVADARPQDAPSPVVEEYGFRALAALPASLDWRTQPFSHVGGPGSRPLPAPNHQLAA
jgi:hypothetical protein